MGLFFRAARRLFFRLMTLWLLFVFAVYIAAAGHTAPNAARPAWLGGNEHPLRDAVCLAVAQGFVCAIWIVRSRRIRRASMVAIFLGALLCTGVAWFAGLHVLCPAVGRLLGELG